MDVYLQCSFVIVSSSFQYFPCSHPIRFSICLPFSFSDVRDLFLIHLICHDMLRSSGHIWLGFESRPHPRKVFLWICCILFFAFGRSGRDYNLVSSRECLCAVIFLNSWFDCYHRVVRWCPFCLPCSFLFLPYPVFPVFCNGFVVLVGFTFSFSWISAYPGRIRCSFFQWIWFIILTMLTMLNSKWKQKRV
jgi:hypothetical protein